VRVSVTRELPGVVNGEVRRAEVLQLLVRVAAAPATHLVTARIRSTFGSLDRWLRMEEDFVVLLLFCGPGTPMYKF
jgi:hypothetical protein